MIVSMAHKMMKSPGLVLLVCVSTIGASVVGSVLGEDTVDYGCKRTNEIQRKLRRLEALKNSLFEKLLQKKSEDLKEKCVECGCARGNSGMAGDNGPQGPPGSIGRPGIPGSKGSRGFPCPPRPPSPPPLIRGDNGPRGEVGEKGEKGNQISCDCPDASFDKPCHHCSRSPYGFPGLPGLDGQSGDPGENGDIGPPGESVKNKGCR